MAKRSTSDEIVLDEIMHESMKEMGKGETIKQEVEAQKQLESSPKEHVKPQFGFKLSEVETPDSFVVAPTKKEEKKPEKEQVILERPSQSLDDDIIVEW